MCIRDRAYVAELVDRDSRTIMNIENKGQYPSFDPVSYTHLDVYKRQAVKTLPGSLGCAGNGALTGAALYLCD